jgi:hypothetical protein
MMTPQDSALRETRPAHSLTISVGTDVVPLSEFYSCTMDELCRLLGKAGFKVTTSCISDSDTHSAHHITLSPPGSIVVALDPAEQIICLYLEIEYVDKEVTDYLRARLLKSVSRILTDAEPSSAARRPKDHT